MINTRLRESSNLFDCFFEIKLLNDPQVVFKYPNTFNDKEILKLVPKFCYPCDIEFTTISHFSFVLTAEDSKWTYGFCRHLPHPNNTCLVLLSSYPWHDTFYKLLNYIADIKSKYGDKHFNIFLDTLFETQITNPNALGMSFYYYVENNIYTYNIKLMNSKNLSTIPDDRNLTEFFNAINPLNMISLFASILNERRILMHSSRLTRLSACIQAANVLIYPMQWQHVFIPILPNQLLDYLSAPMPFLIGVPSPTFKNKNMSILGDDLVIVNIDENYIIDPYDDVNLLPFDVVNHLKKGLKKTQNLFGDGLARLFLKAIVMMVGGYREALRLIPGEKITFNDKAFIKTRPVTMQPFLEKMLNFQIFRQFIENRLEKLNSGLSLDDCFDLELNNYEYKTTNKFKDQYKEWLNNLKKESGNFVKSINPAVLYAYKNVKNKSKQTYKEIRIKLNDNLNKKENSNDTSFRLNSELIEKPNYDQMIPLRRTFHSFY